MERTEFDIPDIINHSASNNYTQIPNDLLRNPKITAKSKAILCLLLSNKKGWKSYKKTLSKMLKEGKSAIETGLAELEQHGYLMRVKYRDKEKKRIRGQFWMYTDHPHIFNNIEKTERMLHKSGMVADWPENLELENQVLGNQVLGNQRLKRPIDKNTKNKNINDSSDQKENSVKTIFGDPIVPTQFEEFWTRYPKKAGKGAAMNAWNKICRKKPRNRPTWKTIITAIRDQKKSDQWQTEKYIPHASTWLNQNRWLDDPEKMKSFNNESSSAPGYKSKTKQDYSPDETY